jgi:antagonist of KipI
MGSKSTNLRAAIGGFNGRALKNGDVLEFGHPYGKLQIHTIPDELLVNYDSEEPLRIIPGPEIKMFGFDAIQNLLTTSYAVTSQSDRMGYRLHGEPLKHTEGKADIISSGIPMGTIQVPGNGQPIIMMADRQTTGGYARMAVVASVDLTRIAQLKPGNKIRFCEIRVEEAQHLFAKRQIMLKTLLSEG